MPRDYSPQIRAAGKVVARPQELEGTGTFLSERTPPPTPPHLHPFRKSHTQALGQRSPLSPARARDPPMPEDKVYGAPSGGSATVADCLVSPPRAKITDNGRPHVYKSELLEPLGERKKVVNIPFPDDLEERRFGKVGDKSESAKNVMYPPHVEGQEMPKWEPGYQKQRGYNWTVDATFRFGKVSSPLSSGPNSPSHTPTASPKKLNQGESGTVMAALTFSNATALIPSPTKAVQQLNHAEIGSPRRTGCAPPEAYDPKRTFGKTDKHRSDTTATLLQNGAGLEDQVGKFCYTSPTLAKLKETDRRQNNGDMSFGAARTIPLPPPHKVKVTPSGTSYIGDANAGDLLYSGETASVARVPLSLEECRGLSDRCAFNLTPEQVKIAYELAQRSASQSPSKARSQGAVSLAPVNAVSFARAVTECGF